MDRYTHALSHHTLNKRMRVSLTQNPSLLKLMSNLSLRKNIFVENFRPVLISHLLQCHKHPTLTAVIPLPPSKFFLTYLFFGDRRHELCYCFILLLFPPKHAHTLSCILSEDNPIFFRTGHNVTAPCPAAPLPLGGVAGHCQSAKTAVQAEQHTPEQ